MNEKFLVGNWVINGAQITKVRREVDRVLVCLVGKGVIELLGQEAEDFWLVYSNPHICSCTNIASAADRIRAIESSFAR